MRFRTNRSKTIALALLAGVLAGVAVAASSLLGEQEIDHVRRDITRVLSEVYQRAQSRAATGDVVRPEYANTTIQLSVPDLSDGWVPSCEIDIQAEPSDPKRYLQARVLVPRDRLSHSGREFIAYAFLADDPVVDSALFDSPPDWLTKAAGGYSDLEEDLQHLLGRSSVDVATVNLSRFLLRHRDREAEVNSRELKVNVYNSSKFGHTNVSFYESGQHVYTIGANIRMNVPQLALPQIVPFERDDGIYRDESADHLAAIVEGIVVSASVPVTDLQYEGLLSEARELEGIHSTTASSPRRASISSSASTTRRGIPAPSATSSRRARAPARLSGSAFR